MLLSLAVVEQPGHVPPAGIDLCLALGGHLSSPWQHPWVAQPQSPLALGRFFPGLALQGCCPEPLWTLPQGAWELCCCLMVVCLCPLQRGHLELGTMWLWLAQHRHHPWEEPSHAQLARGVEAARAERLWEPERRWSCGWQHLERIPQPLPLPGRCLAVPDPQGKPPRWAVPPAHHCSRLGPALSPSPVAPGCLWGETRQPSRLSPAVPRQKGPCPWPAAGRPYLSRGCPQRWWSCRWERGAPAGRPQGWGTPGTCPGLEAARCCRPRGRCCPALPGPARGRGAASPSPRLVLAAEQVGEGRMRKKTAQGPHHPHPSSLLWEEGVPSPWGLSPPQHPQLNQC